MQIPEDAVCAECSRPLTTDNLATRVEDVADAPDGLPAPVLLLVCKRCKAGATPTVTTRNEYGEWVAARPLRASWEWRLMFSDWLEDTLIPWLRPTAVPTHRAGHE